MKRDILFLCQFFYPEYNSSATLPFDTASYLAQNGYSVGALCGYPREYNTSGEVPVRETKDGVSIHRLHYMQLSRHSRLGRLINYFFFLHSRSCSIFSKLRTTKRSLSIRIHRYFLLLQFWPIDSLKRKSSLCPTMFIRKSLMPSGSLREGSTVSSVMQRINRSLFQRAESVVALTDEMREYLLDHRPELSANRVVTISNWAHEAADGSKSAARLNWDIQMGTLSLPTLAISVSVRTKQP